MPLGERTSIILASRNELFTFNTANSSTVFIVHFHALSPTLLVGCTPFNAILTSSLRYNTCLDNTYTPQKKETHHPYIPKGHVGRIKDDDDSKKNGRILAAICTPPAPCSQPASQNGSSVECWRMMDPFTFCYEVRLTRSLQINAKYPLALSGQCEHAAEESCLPRRTLPPTPPYEHHHPVPHPVQRA